MRTTAISMIVPLMIIAMVGLGFLQAKLARKENEAIGLILPTATFIISVLLLLGSLNNDAGSFAEYIGGIAIQFIVFNIPTIIFAFIFAVCRKNYRAKKEIEKMNIMDLE